MLPLRKEECIVFECCPLLLEDPILHQPGDQKEGVACSIAHGVLEERSCGIPRSGSSSSECRWLSWMTHSKILVHINFQFWSITVDKGDRYTYSQVLLMTTLFSSVMRFTKFSISGALDTFVGLSGGILIAIPTTSDVDLGFWLLLMMTASSSSISCIRTRRRFRAVGPAGRDSGVLDLLPPDSVRHGVRYSSYDVGIRRRGSGMLG